jgi:hypothetical protein
MHPFARRNDETCQRAEWKKYSRGPGEYGRCVATRMVRSLGAVRSRNGKNGEVHPTKPRKGRNRQTMGGPPMDHVTESRARSWTRRRPRNNAYLAPIHPPAHPRTHPSFSKPKKAGQRPCPISNPFHRRTPSRARSWTRRRLPHNCVRRPFPTAAAWVRAHPLFSKTKKAGPRPCPTCMPHP